MDSYASWKCIPQQQFHTLSGQLFCSIPLTNPPCSIYVFIPAPSIHNYFYHPHGLAWTIMLLLLVRLFWCEIGRSHVPISHLCITYSHLFSTQVFISKTSITLAVLLWSFSSLSGTLLKHVAQNWTQDYKSCVDYSQARNTCLTCNTLGSSMKYKSSYFSH